MDYCKMTPLLVEAVNALHSEITSLRSENSELRAENEELNCSTTRELMQFSNSAKKRPFVTDHPIPVKKHDGQEKLTATWTR